MLTSTFDASAQQRSKCDAARVVIEVASLGTHALAAEAGKSTISVFRNGAARQFNYKGIGSMGEHCAPLLLSSQQRCHLRHNFLKGGFLFDQGVDA